MPLFMIMGHDVANSSELRQQTREAHLARLHELETQGRLVIAGPTPLEVGQTAMSGSLIIAAFESLEAAQDWASQEPYLTAGVYSHVDIKPFIKVLPSA